MTFRFSHIKTENGDLVATIATSQVDEKNVAIGVAIVSITEDHPNRERGKDVAKGRCKQAANIRRDIPWGTYCKKGEGDLDILGEYITTKLPKLGVRPLNEIQNLIREIRAFTLGV